MTTSARRVLAAFALAGAVLASSATAHADTFASGPTAQARSGGSSGPVRSAVPDRAWQTLRLIDAGQWPPSDGSGTKGGTVWPNRDGALPRTDGDGHPIQYRQWDVNRKKPGQPRDSERIVTGDNGTAWYSPDLFHTFQRMR
ncbi:ribonuclease [Kitasatospora sp. MMS16-BH015]|uniref:ribonuclease domain-containing protein n=1 Tax=Kitasatospora sp. MMS16-BH015 TaxID=2018025 RepID=UPI000CA23651|nr:ribonuclease domain-containing protein [Kitasatospora sp. MMS16-BH015]AUG81536.1 ribonuclease [Kitasatospora sp. MMS16-BH015]